MASPGDRLVEFVVVSGQHSVSQLAELFGPPDGPEIRGQLQDPDESTWYLGVPLASDSSVSEMMDELSERVIERLDQGGAAPGSLRSVLRVVQYLSADEWQGHGIGVSREWIGILDKMNGEIDIDQYVLSASEDE